MGNLSTTQAARRLGVSSATVAAWCRDGWIPAQKVRRRWCIPEEAIEQLADSSSRENGSNAAPFIIAATGGRRGLYRMGSLLGDLRAVSRGPKALGRRFVRKSAYRSMGRMLRRLFP
ncbi:MAG: helix-turn-helix domain-containing protein [Candidatus Bipolaricaulota bacterium]